MNENKIELGGIFSEGYGIIPKKLMKMKFDDKVGKQKGKNIKLVLSYMLSFTGAGKFDCFPSIESISNDLEISKPTVIEAINNAVNLGLISKEQMFPNDPLKHNNKYILKFMDMGGINAVSKESLLTCENGLTFKVNTFEQNNNNINNNINNNNNSLFDSDESGLTKNELLKKLSSSYPASVSMKGGNKRSTQRSVFNKEKAYKIIKEIGIDKAINIINMYIDDCNKNGTFIKNFQTFINNFPSIDDFEYTESEHEIILQTETKNTYFEQWGNTQPGAQND